MEKKNIYILVDMSNNKNCETFVKYTKEYFDAKYGENNHIVTCNPTLCRDNDYTDISAAVGLVFDADIVILITDKVFKDLSIDTKFQVATAACLGKKIVEISKDIEDFSKGIQEINEFLGKKEETEVSSDDLWKVIFLGLTMFLG